MKRKAKKINMPRKREETKNENIKRYFANSQLKFSRQK